MSQWISIKDRLPEGRGFVLIYWANPYDPDLADEGLSHPSRQEAVLAAWLRFYGRDFVSHWMPLPDPPEAAQMETETMP